MKQFISFVKKEFYHILRDWRTLLLLLGIPLAQITILGFAVTDEIKNSDIAILDNAHDLASQNIEGRLNASKYFHIVEMFHNPKEIEEAFRQGKVKMVVVFPEGLREDLLHGNKAQIELVADASDPNMATVVTSYASAIIEDYQEEILSDHLPYQIVIKTRMLYNPELKGAYNFVPGVMGMVLMLICTMMTAVAIVREIEFGTMEVLLVSPLKPYMIVIAKALPYMVISFAIVCIILVLSVYALDVPIAGSLFLLLLESLIFIVASLSLGLIISTFAKTQLTAMMMSMMGLMLPTMMLSGYIYPIENMPYILQLISNIVPAKWYVNMVKAIMIKGLGIEYIIKENIILLGTILFLIWASVLRFKIRLE
jgi:ABC-2 type transport system permease protein